MNKLILKIFSLLLFICVLLSALTPLASADDRGFPNTAEASSVCVYNINTDTSIYSQNTDKKIFPSGAVKMMTGLLACEMLGTRLEETVTLTPEMLMNVQGASIRLKAGMSVSAENLLYGTLCAGGNDAALALAALCCGSTDAFVSAMNRKAAELGMSSTKFTNPTGIDDKSMYSTLEDIMILAKHAYSNELYLKISSKVSYSFTPSGSDEKISFSNKNKLISNDEYKNANVEGLSVGNTDMGGFSVIAGASRKDTKYICAVIGADGDICYRLANSLINCALDKYSYVKLADVGTQICSIPISLAMPNTNEEKARVSCVIMDDIYALTDKNINLESDVRYRYYLHAKNLTAPILEGTIVGGIDVIYGGEVIATGKLVTAKSVSPGTILLLLNNMKSFFLGRAFILSVIFFVILFLVYSLILSKRKHRHRKAPVKRL